jgi:hypothetical protein
VRIDITQLRSLVGFLQVAVAPAPQVGPQFGCAAWMFFPKQNHSSLAERKFERLWV